MNEEIRALLLHSNGDSLNSLNVVLENQFVRTERARSCKEASKKLAGSNPPHLVFTDTDSPDGGWSDVLDMAAGAAQPVGVIVVSPEADIPLYIAVMERRAFDFITHSFTAPELKHILQNAVADVFKRRTEQACLRA